VSGALPEQLPDTFTYGQALSAGLTRHQLYARRDSGELEMVGRGLFRRPTAKLADYDLIEAARRAPQATICLLSALARHNLTDAIPARHDIALPRGAWHPHITAPITWHSFDRSTFRVGRTTVAVDDETIIGLYDAPRTIIDTYRLRNALGADTAHEALRRWLRQGGQPSTLLEIAEAFPRVRTSIRTALEVLL
jgi:predicted transcriptional regulator of viral defense system